MSAFAPKEVIERFKDLSDPVMPEMLQKIEEEGGFSFENVSPQNKKAAYNTVVDAQKKFEEGIVEGLEKGNILAAVAVIHTGRPCNPLSYKKPNPRTKALEGIMGNGGLVVCVYQEKETLGLKKPPVGTSEEEYKKASENFQGLKETYGEKLEDHPVEDLGEELTKGMSGASYLVTTNTGEKYFYSFQSYQVQTLEQGGETTWRVWAGKISSDNTKANEAIQTRKYEVDNFLKEKAGISLGTLLQREQKKAVHAKEFKCD
ncbi:MAG: hypothetical protein PHW76_07360 [Alphaproteobacteria bacterium]|nr:hypothetical protein [Alphaproteobacteria bacterium]